MSTKKMPEKVKSMLSLKRFLKNKADDRLALLQHRQAKRVATELAKHPNKLDKNKLSELYNELTKVSEKQEDSEEHDHSTCDHNH